MKNAKHISILYMTIIIAIICLHASCKKDWFNIKSDQNKTVPSTVKDVEFLLDNHGVMSSNSPGMGELASDGYSISDQLWLSYTQYNDNFTWMIKNAFTWSNKGPSYVDINDWKYSFQKIAYCNTALNRLNYIKPTTSEQGYYNKVKGNALFHRARTYFDLAQIFAEVYNPNKDSQFGLPLKNDVDVTTAPGRSSVYETYRFIIQDLETAADLLPLLPALKTRGSKLSCYGLLARIKLIMGDYQSSLFYANKVLENYSKLIDFNVVSNLASSGWGNDETLFTSYLANYYFNEPPNAVIEPALYNLYSNNDLRKTIFFGVTTNGVIFKGIYTDINYTVACLAIDEIFLIRAESYARTNQIQKAMADVTHLMGYRYKRNTNGSSTYSPQIVTTETDALNVILTERKKELLFRGIRWSDLRRLNLEARFQIKLSRTLGGETFVLEPNSYNYTFPIPLDEISNIQQNPGW